MEMAMLRVDPLKLAFRGPEVAVELLSLWLGARAKVFTDIPCQRLAGAPGSDSVDERVPEALERQYKGAHVLERERDLVDVYNAVDPVGRRGNPRHQHGGEKQKGTLCVRPCGAVRFVVAPPGRVRGGRLL